MPDANALYQALSLLQDPERNRGKNTNLPKRRELIREFLAAPDTKCLVDRIIPSNFELTNNERVNSSDNRICFPYAVGFSYIFWESFDARKFYPAFVLVIAREKPIQQLPEIREEDSIRLLVVDREGAVYFILRDTVCPFD